MAKYWFTCKWLKGSFECSEEPDDLDVDKVSRMIAKKVWDKRKQHGFPLRFKIINDCDRKLNYQGEVDYLFMTPFFSHCHSVEEEYLEDIKVMEELAEKLKALVTDW